MADRVQKLVSEGNGVLASLQIVAKEEGLTIAAVRSMYYRANLTKDRSHGNRLLTKQQEVVLLHLAVSFSVANKGWNMRLFRTVMTKVFDVAPGRHWYRAWLKENKKFLSRRKSKHLAKKRNSNYMLTEVASFIDQVEEMRLTSPMTEHNVVNYDETRVCITTDGEMIVEFNPKDRANAHGHHAHVLGSLLTFVAANGSVLCSCWISKATFDTDSGVAQTEVFTRDTRYPIRSSWARYMGFTDTGYVNDAMFERCVAAFCDEWKANGKSDHVWLFGDQLGSHTRVNLARKALESGVCMWLSPSNTSHFLQPLDEKIFALFKSKISAASYDLSVAASFANVRLQQLWWSLAFDAETTAFTPRVIKSAFRTTGLFPWDPKRIMARAELNAGKIGNQDGAIKRDLVDAAVTVIKSLADRASDLAKKTKGYTVAVVANDLHSPFRRIAYDDEVRSREAAKQLEKDQKLEDKRLKEDLKLKDKLLRRCGGEGCVRASRGGKSWVSCILCKQMFCPGHKIDLQCHLCNADE